MVKAKQGQLLKLQTQIEGVGRNISSPKISDNEIPL